LSNYLVDVMPLIDTVATWVLDHLPYDRDDQQLVAILKAKSGSELLIIFLNWQCRLVAPTPRRVLRSGAFDANPIAKQRAVAIAMIIEDIEKGNLLAKYLSRSVSVGFSLPRDPEKKELSRRKDLDLLLNDWGIHHVHISSEVEADGFVKRSGPVMFAIFKPETAYLIDIVGHGDWACERVIRVIVETWPNQGLVNELKGIVGTSRSYTDRERAQLRSAGMSTCVEIDGRVYMASLGISTAGTSTATAMHAMRILRTLKNFDEQTRENPARIVDLIRQHGGEITGELSFAFSFFQNGFGVLETKSRVGIVLSG
jgi:hypothetical protein